MSQLITRSTFFFYSKGHCFDFLLKIKLSKRFFFINKKTNRTSQLINPCVDELINTLTRALVLFGFNFKLSVELTWSSLSDSVC
jgi:hypothetical protein